MAVNKSFWLNKRVFLTGHTGFKGSWLSLWLQELGANVTGYSLVPPTNPSLFEEANVAFGMKSIIGDIRDLEALELSMINSQPEIVIHMAAQPLVRLSFDNPLDTYSINIIGLVNILESVRKISGLKTFLNITSDKCYENKEWHWGYRENESLGGYDPYSSSKACAEIITSAYRCSYFNPLSYDNHGLGIATARAGNVIGGGDWATDRLIPDMISAFSLNKPAIIRNPNSIRPWQHVLEALHGYIKLVENLYSDGSKYCEAWNFGPNDEDAKTVNWVANRMSELWGKNANWLQEKKDDIHEASYLKLDISKSRKKLGWAPVLNLDKALKLTIDWSLARSSGMNMREFTIDQINEYQALL